MLRPVLNTIKSMTELTGIKSKAAYVYSLLRSTAFLGQNLSLPLLELLATGKSKAVDPQFLSHLQVFLQDMNLLLKRDAQNIAAGFYPMEVLKPESPIAFLSRYPKILKDAFAVADRRNSKKTKDFEQSSEEFFHELPEYYRRNFHFQTGGYLTDESAQIYEHQVEILFSGAADAMRRMIIPLMKKQFQDYNGQDVSKDGSGLHLLEIASGTGRLTKFMKLAFPKARITVLDLSDPYLKRAKQNLKEFDRINFIQGDAANLPFQDHHFDGVYSCFLFHELPFEERKKVLKESHRVTKPGGLVGFVDSVQKDDKPKLNWAIKQFPVDFHEPFYKNYTENPMEGLMKYLGFENFQAAFGFFSKAVVAQKPTRLDV